MDSLTLFNEYEGDIIIESESLDEIRIIPGVDRSFYTLNVKNAIALRDWLSSWLVERQD